MKKLILFLMLSTFVFTACNKNNNPVTPPPSAKSRGIYVVNEGLFGQNNSTLSYINLTKKTITNNAYSSANNGQSLGDNANSMAIFSGKGYIAVDNSNKVEIINLDDFKSEGFIDLGANGSPREIYIKDANTAYVTSLNTDQVVKLDLINKSVVARINVGSKPEGLNEADGKLFVANSGFGAGNTVSVINIALDLVTETLQVGMNPRVVLSGPDGFIYVICSGSYTDTTVFSGVYRIDPMGVAVLDSIQIKGNPGDAVFLDVNTFLVINNDGVVKVNLANKTVSETPFIPGLTVNNIFGVVYSIAYDNINQTIYCGNPKDFTQNGEVVAFDLNGNETARYGVGINPGTIIIR